MSTPSTKIEGMATISSVGTTACGGPNETPIVRFYFRDGREYRWISEVAGYHNLQPGQTLHIRAFIRADGRTVYRVTVTKEGVV